MVSSLENQAFDTQIIICFEQRKILPDKQDYFYVR